MRGPCAVTLREIRRWEVGCRLENKRQRWEKEEEQWSGLEQGSPFCDSAYVGQNAPKGANQAAWRCTTNHRVSVYWGRSQGSWTCRVQLSLPCLPTAYGGRLGESPPLSFHYRGY